MKHGQILIGIWLCTQLLTGCTGTPSISGTGGQTTNGITASIQFPDGKKAANLPFRVRTSDYLTSLSSSDSNHYKNGRTDSSGNLKIDSLEKGSYIIEVYDEKGLAVAFSEQSTDSSIEDAGVNTLSPTGRVYGHVSPDDLKTGDVFVQIFGLERIAKVDTQSGAFTFNDLPAGKFSFRLVSMNSTSVSDTISNIQVRSNDTTIVSAFSSWTNSAKLFLNTTPSGADISTDVTDFPVLIRLNAVNFNFDQAGGRGEDIRFTKANGSQLPYEIERWDEANKSAELWVEVDTVFGNNDKQFITMYWGFSGASSQSNGAAVFDMTEGFEGVWHLGETESAIAHDATANHYDGTPSDTAPLSSEGIIGTSRSFNGSSNYLHMKGTSDSKLDFKENGNYTISAWVYADSIDNGYHFIAGKGNTRYFLKFKTAAPASDTMVWEFVEFQSKAGWYITNSLGISPAAKKWIYITGVRNGASQYLYIDGTLIDSTVVVSATSDERKTGEDFSIGGFISLYPNSNEGWCSFKGKIDEVRISSTAPCADWIKLCYMNQKSDDQLVKLVLAR
ncbi:MAG TPA: DUF2341 domain-containing protein [Chitinispirillaceae bacterium]|nr:DUF2341 domain-containing protein [Chitinispirillaceae bacterium]